MIKKSLVLMFCVISSVLFAAEQQSKAKLEFNENNNSVLWNTTQGNEVQIGTPVLLIKDWIQGKNKTAPLNIELTEKSLTEDSAVLNYSVALDKTNYGITGSYSISLSRDKATSLLLYNSKLSFDSPVRTDVTVHNNFKINNNSATEIMLPERDGILQTYNLKPGKKGAGRYELGAEATKGINCNEIGMPVVGLKLEKKNFAVSIDPYCGGFIQAKPTKKETSVMVSTTYNGTTVPVNNEKRKIALEFVDRVNNSIRNPRSVNPILLSFYNTIPEIKSGPDWLHDVQLTYYDYLSDGGEGWYEGLQHLADRIPEAHRDNVAVCQHGWYDYFQHYAYDDEKGKMEESWTAFPGTRQIAMSIEKMHKRFQFAKELGFRTLIYFADGTNSDSGFSEFNPDYVLRDSEGNSRQGWKGPDSQGRPVRMDPAVNGVRQWFKGYLKTLIEEFGNDLDGFVWDETFYIPVHTISYAQETPAYSDRAMLSLVSELTQIVQQYQHIYPGLAFLVSDWGNNTNALVSHGTWEDTVMHPERWYRSLFSNYRNSLWSNLWLPVTHAKRNELAAELGFPQGVSNGWRDNQGPHEMPQEILNAVIDRFIENVEEGKNRPRYFNTIKQPIRYFKPEN